MTYALFMFGYTVAMVALGVAIGTTVVADWRRTRRSRTALADLHRRREALRRLEPVRVRVHRANVIDLPAVKRRQRVPTIDV